MPARIVVGANWGDEGKGRMVDYFASEADVVVRYQGGHNAGHTIVNDKGKFVLRLIPSGIFNDGTLNVIGPGCVINLEALASEIAGLREKQIDVTQERLCISDRATVCFPFHALWDLYEEKRLGKDKVGSTLQGIAPAYGDRYMRHGIQLGWLKDLDFTRTQVHRIVALKNELFCNVYKEGPINSDEVMDWLVKFGQQFLPYIRDVTRELEAAANSGKSILLEAQLGSLRDVTYGIYPFTTSSNPLAAYAPVGSGFLSMSRPTVTAVVKAFSTCVGEGPFVTEMTGDRAESFRKRTGEYGAATGRPRRIGHFDAVATRYGAKAQGATEIALTKLDNLSGEGQLSICTAYKTATGIFEDFPLLPDLVKAAPVYETLEGWEDDVTAVRSFHKLPRAAQQYVSRIEELIGVHVKYVSVGPERDSIIVR